MGYLEQVVKFLMYTTPQTSHYAPIGRHCCLWCHITSEQLRLGPSLRGPLKLRSDSTLKDDLAKFKADGSNIKRAKFFNNVIRDPLFTIGLAQA